jgi:hypothetical protein
MILQKLHIRGVRISSARLLKPGRIPTHAGFSSVKCLLVSLHAAHSNSAQLAGIFIPPVFKTQA